MSDPVTPKPCAPPTLTLASVGFLSLAGIETNIFLGRLIALRREKPESRRPWGGRR